MSAKPNIKKMMPNVVLWFQNILNRNEVSEVRLLGEQRYSCYYSKDNPKDYKKVFNDILPNLQPRNKIPFGSYTYGNGEAKGCYYTLNMPIKDIAARYNTPTRAKTTTSDSEIVFYTHIPIDIDPKRPSGVSSTAKEKLQSFHKVCKPLIRYLNSEGFKGYLGDSGNGWHYLIPVMYANTPENVIKVKNFLLFLSDKFSNEIADVDISVFNPARIFKMYGTKSCKGADTAERPHRYANIHYKPTDKLPEQKILEHFEEEVKVFIEKKKIKSTTQNNNKTVDFEEDLDHNEVIKIVLEKADIEYKLVEKGGRNIYTFLECPLPDHQNHDHKYECCVVVEPDGTYSGHCAHGHALQTPAWLDFKEAIKFDEFKPKHKSTISENDFVDINDPKFKSKMAGKKLSSDDIEIPEEMTQTSDDINRGIFNTEYNKTEYAKFRYVFESATLFPKKCISVIGGEQGSGKSSTLVAGILIPMIKGEKILGSFIVPKVKTLYIQSDTDEGRFMSRFCTPYGYDPERDRDQLLFIHTKNADKRVVKDRKSVLDFIEFCVKEKEFKLVVLDNRTSLFPREIYGDKAQQWSMELVEDLKKLAIQYDIAIVLVEHMIKPQRKKWELCSIPDILGSSSKLADQVVGINKRYNRRTQCGQKQLSFFIDRPTEGIIVPLKNCDNLDIVMYKILFDSPQEFLWEEFQGVIVDESLDGGNISNTDDQDITKKTKNNNIYKLLEHVVSNNIKELTKSDCASIIGKSLTTAQVIINDLSTLGVLKILPGKGRSHKTILKVDLTKAQNAMYEHEVDLNKIEEDIEIEKNIDYFIKNI